MAHKRETHTPKCFHDCCDDRPEQVNVVVVIDPILERHVDGVVFPGLHPRLEDVPRAREEVVAVLVERHSHHTVCAWGRERVCVSE